MLTKQQALTIIEGTKGNRTRVPFHIMFVTANREQWVIKKNAIKRLSKLELGLGLYNKNSNNPNSEDKTEITSEIAELQKTIKTIDIGGKLIEHEECVRSAVRGMHAKQKQTALKNEVVDRRGSHYTSKNIVFMPGENVRRIHNDLILEVNHIEVMY